MRYGPNKLHLCGLIVAAAILMWCAAAAATNQKARTDTSGHPTMIGVATGTNEIRNMRVTDDGILYIAASDTVSVTLASTTVNVGNNVALASATINVGNAVSLASSTINIGNLTDITGASTTVNVGNVVITDISTGTVNVGNKVELATTTVNVGNSVSLASATVNIGNLADITGASTTVNVGNSVSLASATINVGNLTDITGASTTVNIGNSVALASATLNIGNSVSFASATVNVGNKVDLATTTVNVANKVELASSTVKIWDGVNAVDVSNNGGIYTTLISKDDIDDGLGWGAARGATFDNNDYYLHTSSNLHNTGPLYPMNSSIGDYVNWSDLWATSVTATAAWVNPATSPVFFFPAGGSTYTYYITAVHMSPISSMDYASTSVPFEISLLPDAGGAYSETPLFEITCDMNNCNVPFNPPIRLRQGVLNDGLVWRIRLSIRVGTVTAQVWIWLEGYGVKN